LPYRLISPFRASDEPPGGRRPVFGWIKVWHLWRAPAFRSLRTVGLCLSVFRGIGAGLGRLVGGPPRWLGGGCLRGLFEVRLPG
jgi:hypothetical protein